MPKIGPKSLFTLCLLLAVPIQFAQANPLVNEDCTISSGLKTRKILNESIEIKKRLNSGAYGQVYLASSVHQPHCIYAVKVYNLFHGKATNEMEKELSAYSLLERNDFFPKIFGHAHYYEDEESNQPRIPNSPFYRKDILFMEYVAGGDFFNFVELDAYQKEWTVFYAAEVALALDFIHRQNLVYRDLKLENVMLSSDGHIKLVDMGMCKILSEFGQKIQGSPCGTFGFMAPEMEKGTYDFRVDWYCLGILIFEMSTTYWERKISFHQFIARLEKKKDKFEKMHKDVLEVVLKLTSKNPEKRISSLEQLKEMKFFQGIDWEKLENHADIPPHTPEENFNSLSADYSKTEKFLGKFF